jgi:O-antigen/teichoic acid export membrane protein
VDTVNSNFRSLVIGKVYSSDDLAFYDRGKQIPFVFISNINAAINSVLFPVLSKAQDEPGQVKGMVRRSIKTSTYVITPLLIGLMAVAEPFVELLLKAKWLPCVPYLRILCVTFVFWPIKTPFFIAIKAIGRSGVVMRLGILDDVLGFVALLAAMRFGVMAIAYSLLAASLIGVLIIIGVSAPLLRYRLKELLRDVLPNFAISAAMGACVYLLARQSEHVFAAMSRTSALLLTLAIAACRGDRSVSAPVALTRNDSCRYL